MCASDADVLVMDSTVLRMGFVTRLPKSVHVLICGKAMVARFLIVHELTKVITIVLATENV